MPALDKGGDGAQGYMAAGLFFFVRGRRFWEHWVCSNVIPFHPYLRIRTNERYKVIISTPSLNVCIVVRGAGQPGVWLYLDNFLKERGQ